MRELRITMVFDTEYWCRDISNGDSNPGSAACTGSWHIGRLEITYIGPHKRSMRAWSSHIICSRISHPVLLFQNVTDLMNWDNQLAAKKSLFSFRELTRDKAVTSVLRSDQRIGWMPTLTLLLQAGYQVEVEVSCSVCENVFHWTFKTWRINML